MMARPASVEPLNPICRNAAIKVLFPEPGPPVKT
jgi:hypothetical protein